jgi:hypothetical protein
LMDNGCNVLYKMKQKVLFALGQNILRLFVLAEVDFTTMPYFMLSNTTVEPISQGDLNSSSSDEVNEEKMGDDAESEHEDDEHESEHENLNHSHLKLKVKLVNILCTTLLYDIKRISLTLIF